MLRRWQARTFNALAGQLGVVVLAMAVFLGLVGLLMKFGRDQALNQASRNAPEPVFESFVEELDSSERPAETAIAAAVQATVQALGMGEPISVSDAEIEWPGVPPERVAIPAVEIDTDIIEVGWEARIVNGEKQGNVWQTAEDSAGFHKESAFLGKSGNTVISGHNNIGGAVFRRLHEVERGDAVLLYGEERQWAYEVVHKFVLWEEGASVERRRANARWIDETQDERITLISCYPPWGNSHRVIVVARPVYDEDIDLSQPQVAR